MRGGRKARELPVSKYSFHFTALELHSPAIPALLMGTGQTLGLPEPPLISSPQDMPMQSWIP